MLPLRQRALRLTTFPAERRVSLSCGEAVAIIPPVLQLAPRNREARNRGRPEPKGETAALTGSSGRRLQSSYAANSDARSELLCLNDSRRDEENQLLVRGVDLSVLEQVAQVGQVAQQRHLRDVARVLRLNDAAVHPPAAVGHQDLTGGLLRDPFGLARR